MKQKEWFWCGTLLFVLLMFVALQRIQPPVYPTAVGGICALLAVILFGCGLRAYAQEMAADRQRQFDELQKQFELRDRMRQEREDVLWDRIIEQCDMRYQSCSVVLSQCQENLATTTEEVKKFRSSIAGESAKPVYDLLLEQHTTLLAELRNQAKETNNYRRFMLDRPWEEVKELAQVAQSIDGQIDGIMSAVDSNRTDTGRQLKRVLESMQEEYGALQERLQYLCDSLEKQNKENRDSMERIMQGYSDVTAQDIKVLTALTKGK